MHACMQACLQASRQAGVTWPPRVRQVIKGMEKEHACMHACTWPPLVRQVIKGMETEHHADDKERFRTALHADVSTGGLGGGLGGGGWGVTSSSAIEWAFVVSPEKPSDEVARELAIR